MKSVFVLGAAALALAWTPAAAQSTREAAQAVLTRHAIAGRIVLLNGAASGSWLMERPVTGVIAARDCFTNFASPNSSRLVNVNDPANHMGVGWQEAGVVASQPGYIEFTAPWVGAGNYARLVIADSTARAEVEAALRFLVLSCNPAASAPAAPAVVIARAGSRALPLGRAFEVTSAMVTTDPPGDLFRSHHFVLTLNGRRGDRFRIRWSGEEAPDLDYDSGIGVEYPSGSTIFDKNKSVIVTLEQDGDQVLTFDQLASTFSGSNSGSLAGPSITGSSPRALVPFTMTVEKLN